MKEFLTTNNIIDKISKLNDTASQRHQSLAEMAIAWTLVTSVIIGCSNVTQLSENLNSINNIVFEQNELNLIDDILFV